MNFRIVALRPRARAHNGFMARPVRAPPSTLWRHARAGELRLAAERASAQIGAGVAGAPLVELHLVRTFCALRRGMLDDAARELDQAGAAADSLSAARPALHVLAWRAEAACFRGDYPAATAMAREALAGLVAARDWSHAAFAVRVEIAALLARTEYDAIALLAPLAVRYARASRDDYVKVQVYNVLGAFHFDRATAHMPRHVRSHITSVDPAHAAVSRHEARHALRHFELARRAALRSGNAFAAWYVAGNIERLEILLGRAQRALAPMRRRLERLQSKDARYDEIVMRSNLAWALRCLGRHRESLQQLDAGLELARCLGTANVLLQFIYYDRSLVLDALGDAPAAMADYRRYARLVSGRDRAAAAPGTAAAERRPLEPHFLKRADRFVAQNLGRRPSVCEMARQCGVSWRTLDKAFCDFRGVTPVAHARNMRLDAARTALQATGCSVAEAARLHGFGSVTTFSLEYRRRFGAPPSALTRKARAAG